MSMLSRFAATGGGGDLYWSNVSFLLVGNGANGTTTNIVDSSSKNLAITNSGSTVISTAQSKYGSGSVAFNSSQFLSMTSPSNLSFGTNDFTVEFWFYATSSNSFDTLFSTTVNYTGSADLRLNTNGGSRTIQVASNANTLITGSTAFSLNTWNYLAICRNGTSLNLYLNGVNTGSVSNNTNFVSDTFMIAAIGAGFYFNGYMYDFRVTKGVARYSGSTMTVPTAPLPIG